MQDHAATQQYSYGEDKVQIRIEGLLNVLFEWQSPCGILRQNNNSGSREKLLLSF